ncbi:MAG: DUF262 domain-containing protein, partial [Proteobacteria bacterium]
MVDDRHSLIDAIARNVRNVSTHALDVSFNELVDMHETRELDIKPDYQRTFRWSPGQQSRFIESLLLEMPVPPIFVIETEAGHYELIDGMQRISTYLHFRGKLEPQSEVRDLFNPNGALRLVECDIVPELNHQTFDDLPTALQIRLKRSFIRMEVIRKGTDPRIRYHMFKRLNTGGDPLSEQQARDAAIRMLDGRFPDFLVSAANEADFGLTVRYLTDERQKSSYERELVLRFFALKNARDRFKHSVVDFLTDFAEGVADPGRGEPPFDYEVELDVFRQTFRLLAASIGEYAFGFANRSKNQLSLGFSIYHFEALTMGLQSVLDRLDPTDVQQMQKLNSELQAIKLAPAFQDLTTGGG